MRNVRFVLPAILFFAFICWIIYLANSGDNSLVFRMVRSVPFGDKIGHAVLFGLLAFLANLAFRWRFSRVVWLQVGSLSVLAFAVIEEFSQALNPHRTLDAVDVVADVFGIAVATWFSVSHVHNHTESAESPPQ
ncbi:MAG: VanZ family protein [Planctomycetaceae bacterium]